MIPQQHIDRVRLAREVMKWPEHNVCTNAMSKVEPPRVSTYWYRGTVPEVFSFTETGELGCILVDHWSPFTRMDHDMLLIPELEKRFMKDGVRDATALWKFHESLPRLHDYEPGAVARIAIDILNRKDAPP